MIREKKELRQRELAELAGVSDRTIGRIERGEVDVRLSILAKISKALGVSLKEIFYETK